ncbi:MAG: hypothetical protein QOI25_393, partial [Mycobacterium sp.]|nr:hypothetical protein [Mycobacterium sp.]
MRTVRCLDGLLAFRSQPRSREAFGASPIGNSTHVIGKLRTVVVDCKNPETLAGFYAE